MFLLQDIKKILGVVLVIAVIGEMLLFPSVANFYGCLMATISYLTFCFFLKKEIVVNSPFAFLVFLSMFMYRFLPLPATLLEFKPITYGFERPFETFGYETLLFLVSTLAFYLATVKGKTSVKNSLWTNSLNKLGFFNLNKETIWILGLFGVLVRIYNFSAGIAEYGDVGGKFLSALNYLMYAPLILAFPNLSNIRNVSIKYVYVYGILIFILNIASNSRQGILAPIATLVLLFFLNTVKNNIKIREIFSPVKILGLGLVLMLLLNFISNISLAMLYTRAVRSKVSNKELFVRTVETLQNPDLMQRLRETKEKLESGLSSYNDGWTEDYLDNFMLNRYANMRITDQTIFYAQKKGYGNYFMQLDLKEKIIMLLPSPIANFFGYNFDKEKAFYSRGDFLYGKGLGGFKVTSHVGDGLATFSYFYFIIQFIVTFILFKLLNSFIFYTGKQVIYAPFALIKIFSFLGMFRNAGGIHTDLGYILRGYLQGLFTYLIIYLLIYSFLKTFYFKYSD